MPNQDFFQQIRSVLQDLTEHVESSEVPLPMSQGMCQSLQSGLDSWEETGDVGCFVTSMLSIAIVVTSLEERVATLNEAVDSTSRSLEETTSIVDSIAEKHSSLVDSVGKLTELTRNAVISSTD